MSERDDSNRKLVKWLIAVFAIGLLVWIVPNFIRARSTTNKNPCINSLRQIDGAKQQWASENHKTDSDIPTKLDVVPYLKNNSFPNCPQGGTYKIGRVGTDPTCSFPGHKLPTP